MAVSAKASVLTGDGWIYAKDIRPGDWVFNRLGAPVKVKTSQTFRSEECYRVTFDDYLTVEGDRHLAFPSEDRQYVKRTRIYRGVMKRTAQPKLRTVIEMQEKGLIYREVRMFFSVPTTEPIQLPIQPLGIPAFVYGFWFFSRKPAQFMTAPKEYAEIIYENFQNAGYKIEKLGDYQGRYEKFRTEPSIWRQLAGQIPHKIAPNYINGSPEQRLDLIQGIIYTKPCRKSTNYKSILFKSKKKSVITTLQYLAESIGSKTRLTFDKSRKCHILRMTRLTPFIELNAEKKPFVHYARRYVKSIEPIPAQLCVHIETEEENGSFLVNEGFIPCH